MYVSKKIRQNSLQCPHAVDYESICDDQDTKIYICTNARLSIIGLGLYFLESKGCHANQIIPYLLWIEDKLLDIEFTERQTGRFNLPVAEVFAFAINTLLSDMASIDTGFREQILDAQKSLLDKCVGFLEIVHDDSTQLDSGIPI